MESNTLELNNENQTTEQKNNPSQIATEIVLEKLKQAHINVITDQKAMQAILDAGINVQKMAAHYGTNQNIENAESFNGYGVYVLSVNEENARNLGLKIASKKYGNSFYINNQPLQEFLQEHNFSPYWQSVISQVQNPSNETLLNSIMTSDVKGNLTLQKEQNQLSTLCSLNLINYKREQTFLYSVEIPDNDGTNYLFYDKTIGLENAERINAELSKLGTNWKVSRNDTGNSVYFNILSDKVFTSQKQASEFLQKVGYVGMETSNENYIIFDDREMNINNRVQYMITEDGELYGFAYNGQIYADKNLMNSNVLAHEYTHLWDNYTKNENPELWKKGKDVFKKTALWKEVVNDPSYQNIKDNEDEILSECHARICGKFAQSVLERIAQENGENAKNAVIDWNKEVEAFVAKEFGFAPELGSETYISETINAESMKDFLSASIKDLMNGVGFEKDIKKAQRYHTENILQLNRSIGQYKDNFLDEESQVALEKLDKYLQEIRTAASPIKADEFLKNIQNIMHVDEEKSKTVRHFIGKEESNLRISNHSANAVHAQFRPNETSVVIKLSSTKFKADKNSYLAEYVYESKNLSKEKQLGIINGLKDWINTGDFTDKNFDKEYYSPSKELYMQMKNQNAKPQKMVISNGVEHNMNENYNPIEPLYFGDINEDGSVNTYNKEQYIEKFGEEPPESARLDDDQIKNWQNEENKNLVDADYTDPIEALEEAYNTLENPPTEEDIEAEKILHDKYIQDELDKTIEDLQANGGLSDAAIEAESSKQEELYFSYGKDGLEFVNRDEFINTYNREPSDSERVPNERIKLQNQSENSILQNKDISQENFSENVESVSEEKMTFTDKNVRSLLLDYCEPFVKTAYYKELFGEQKNELTDEEIRKLSKSINLGDLLNTLDEKSLRDFAKDTGIPVSSDDERQRKLIVEGIKKLQKKETEQSMSGYNDEDHIDKIMDSGIESVQVNGGLSEAAIEAEIATQEEAEAYEEDSSYDEEEEPVLTINDTNGNLHFPQEIVSILENFQKVESSKWNLPVEEKTAVFHLIQLTEMDKNDFENSLAKLQEYMNTEEFKREEENYAKIFTPILLTSLGQDYDKETQTFSSEKFSYKFSTDELKEEILVTKGEIKSILGNDFTGGNIKLTQDFQNDLVEKGLVKPEEKFVLINEVEAVAKGTKIKPDQPYVTLTIPVNNNGKTEFVQTKYYHVSALEEPQKLEKNVEEAANQNEAIDKNIIIYGETKVPEFAMITQHGLENFKDMIIDSFEESSGTYLLKSEDGKNNVRVTENTLKTLTSDEYAKKTETYTQDTKTAEKMIDTQYNDFFELRDNCANNFRHNLSVFCRKEANSPLDALKIANHIISEMPKEEKRKTKELLNLLRKDGQSVNEVLIETFHEAVKEIPLNEDYIKHHRYEKMIARPMYDTLSTKGEKIDRDFDLKIGDSVEVVFKVNKDAKTHSLRKESIYQNCTIISSSKENNMVTLMDGNKSFYDVPRDTFLAEYGKQQYKAQKIEHKVHRQQSMQIEIGR